LKKAFCKAAEILQGLHEHAISENSNGEVMNLAGQAVVSIWHDIADEGRDEFYWWHLHEHMPERAAVRGIIRGRRYIAETGAPEFFTLYEAEDMDALAGKDYLDRLNNPTPWTISTVRHFRNVARSIQWVRYSNGPGMGGYLLTLQFEADDAEQFAEKLAKQVLRPASDIKGVTGVHLCQTDLSTSDTPTRERKQRVGGTDMPGWAILIEAARRDEIDHIRNDLLSDTACKALGMASAPKAAIYRLEYVCTQP